jgi:hypothetical protein
MKILQPICIVTGLTTAIAGVATAIAVVYLFAPSELTPPPEKPAAASMAPVPSAVAPGEVPKDLAKVETDEAAKVESGAPAKPETAAPEVTAALPATAAPPATEAPPATVTPPVEDAAAEPEPAKRDFSYLAYYAYSEVPPDIKPADTVEESLKDVPVGTPTDEIKLAAEAFGLDVTFMKAVAKIESDFDPKQRTGSYIGLFQLSHYEFDKYGSGEITNPRDNAIAAAYKFATAAMLFEIESHKKATRDDLYLIHQQGTQGAAEHVSHPERVAWKSMCATDEGHDKGEKWCKRAIWQNTLPAIKQVWKSVDNLTSGAFVAMWQQRIAMFYARYSEALSAK